MSEILINEWLANPVGDDISGEWIELQNFGTQKVSLKNWSLNTKSGKTYIFKSGEIDPQGYFLLKRSESGLSLRNSDEAIYLLDPSGKKADESSFLGTFPEGKSLNRVGEQFIVGEPSPGIANTAKAPVIVQDNYALGAQINKNISTWDFVGMLLGTALFLSISITLYISKNEEARKFLFGSN